MSIVRCHHHGFTVSDLERALAFYRDVLGLELTRVSERRNLPSYDRITGHENVALNVAILQHPVGEFILELVEYVSPEGQKRALDNPFVGSSHPAFEVDDVDAVYAAVCAFLLSDDAGLVTGQDLVVDGGHIACQDNGRYMEISGLGDGALTTGLLPGGFSPRPCGRPRAPTRWTTGGRYRTEKERRDG